MRAVWRVVSHGERAGIQPVKSEGERDVDDATGSRGKRSATVVLLGEVGSAGRDTRDNERRVADVRKGHGLRITGYSEEPDAESETCWAKTRHRSATGSSQVDHLETTPGVVSDEQDVARGPGSRRSERDVDRATRPGSELTSAVVDRGESAGRGSDARDHQRP